MIFVVVFFSQLTVDTFLLGACVGYTDYMLHQPRSFFAKAAVSPTVVACFTYVQYELLVYFEVQSDNFCVRRRKMEALIEEKSFFAMCMLQVHSCSFIMI